MKLNPSEKKLMVWLASLPPKSRNTFTLTAKMGISYTATYNYLRVMEAKELITRIKAGNNKTFYQIKNEEALELSVEFVKENKENEENGDLRRD